MNASTMPRVPASLFVPSPGLRPPLLAGREAEIRTLRGCFAAAEEGKGRSVVLIGPRGNGKTTLLEDFARRCREVGADVVCRTPDKLRSEEDLAVWLLEADLKRRGAQRKTVEEDASWPAALEPLANFAQKAWGKSAKIRKSAIPGLLSSNLKGMDEALRATTLRCVDLLLEYAARWRPRAALVDEAHTLDPGIAQSLLNTAQNVNSAGGAFLLVLAGTPQLPNTLREANATFWSRCKKIGIGRLSDEATREALEKPLAGYGVSFAAQALDEVVEESQRYPYFIQLWGKALCEALPEGASRIDSATVEAARPAFEEEKNGYYADRLAEIEKRGLEPAAEAVARLFDAYKKRGGAGGVQLLGKTIKRALRDAGVAGDEASAFEMTTELGDLGYLWMPPAGARYEPGIPSLMTRVIERSEDFDPAPE